MDQSRNCCKAEMQRAGIAGTDHVLYMPQSYCIFWGYGQMYHLTTVKGEQELLHRSLHQLLRPVANAGSCSNTSEGKINLILILNKAGLKSEQSCYMDITSELCGSNNCISTPFHPSVAKQPFFVPSTKSRRYLRMEQRYPGKKWE